MRFKIKRSEFVRDRPKTTERMSDLTSMRKADKDFRRTRFDASADESSRGKLNTRGIRSKCTKFRGRGDTLRLTGFSIIDMILNHDIPHTSKVTSGCRELRDATNKSISIGSNMNDNKLGRVIPQAGNIMSSCKNDRENNVASGCKRSRGERKKSARISPYANEMNPGQIRLRKNDVTSAQKWFEIDTISPGHVVLNADKQDPA